MEGRVPTSRRCWVGRRGGGASWHGCGQGGRGATAASRGEEGRGGEDASAGQVPQAMLHHYMCGGAGSCSDMSGVDTQATQATRELRARKHHPPWWLRACLKHGPGAGTGPRSPNREHLGL